MIGLSARAQETPVKDPHRVAMVIGIGEYDTAPDLANPINDARAVAAELWESGFEVIELLNPDIITLRSALQVMGERLRNDAHAAFFFAGHGIQIGTENYLLASDVRLDSGASAVLGSAVSANEIGQSLADSGSELSLMILDACRNNPFSSDASAGLAPITIRGENEVLIAYATSPGAVAFDGPDGGNSPFSSAVIRHLRTPKTEITEIFDRVRADVRSQTGGLQTPWVNSTLSDEFFLRSGELVPTRGGGDAVDTLGLLPPSSVLEAALWTSAVRGTGSAELELYLEQFPNGRFSQIARDRLNDDTSPGLPLPEGDEDTRVIIAAGTKTRLGTLISADSLPQSGDVIISQLSEGVLIEDTRGIALLGGDTISANALPDLRFVTGNSELGYIGSVTFLPDAATPISLDLVVDIETCDMVAGYPHDPQRVGRGARLELMRPRLAISACTSAVRRYPDNVRFKAVLGRAYRSAQDFTNSKKWNQMAIEADYSAALAAEGKMLLLGQGSDPDPDTSFEYFKRAADLGDTWGLNALGEAYLFGNGVERDPERGIALIMASAESGNDWAHTLMGRVYEEGQGVDVDYDQALEWFHKAAAMGDPSAKLELSHAYRNGLGTDVDKETSLRWLLSAAAQGWTFAQARLGREYAKGELMPRDAKTAVHWYKQASDRNDPEGQFLLAQALLSGDGVDADPGLAQAMLQVAHVQGNAQASLRLGREFESGKIFPKDLPRALEMFDAAWAGGHPAAGRKLANALLKGYDGTPNPKRGVAVYQEVVDQGNTWAMRDLAGILRDGKLAPKNEARSAALTIQAAEAGNTFAYRDLAKNLVSGFGGRKDEVAAFEFMAKAANADNAWAQLDLAKFYEKATGTAEDPALRTYWLLRALANTDRKAKEVSRERLEQTDLQLLISGAGQILRETKGLTGDNSAVIALQGANPAKRNDILDVISTIAE